MIVWRCRPQRCVLGYTWAMFPTVSASDIAWISTAQMVEVDRVMIEDLGIDLPRMMEGAGRTLAQVAERLFSPASVVVAAGPGGNGGGGLVAARHLANHGVDVSVMLSRPAADLGPVPRAQHDILERLGVHPVDVSRLSATACRARFDHADLIIDAVLGYSLKGAPRGGAGDLVNEMVGRRVLSLDTPSGLDTSTGGTPGLHVMAEATMTLAAPKVGLRDHEAVGRLLLADISVPPAVYRDFDAGPGPVFAAGPILEVIH